MHFTLRHCDVERTLPTNGPLKGLSENTGCLEERLNSLTKASCTLTADVVIAYITFSGLCPGVWYDRILQNSGMDEETASTSELPICRTSNGTAWTSRCFRTTYPFWPLWHEQRFQGDPSVPPYDKIKRPTQPHISQRLSEGEAEKGGAVGAFSDQLVALKLCFARSTVLSVQSNVNNAKWLPASSAPFFFFKRIKLSHSRFVHRCPHRRVSRGE